MTSIADPRAVAETALIDLAASAGALPVGEVATVTTVTFRVESLKPGGGRMVRRLTFDRGDTGDTPYRPFCLPGCASDHSGDAALRFRLCRAPIATVPVDAHAVAVSVTRVVEAGETHTTVSLGVDGREELELAPDVARWLAAAVMRGAELAEQSASGTET